MSPEISISGAPAGFTRGLAPGWHIPIPSGNSKTVAKIKQDNAMLKEQLDAQAALMTELAARVEELAAKKGKK